MSDTRVSVDEFVRHRLQGLFHDRDMGLLVGVDPDRQRHRTGSLVLMSHFEPGVFTIEEHATATAATVGPRLVAGVYAHEMIGDRTFVAYLDDPQRVDAGERLCIGAAPGNAAASEVGVFIASLLGDDEALDRVRLLGTGERNVLAVGVAVPADGVVEFHVTKAGQPATLDVFEWARRPVVLPVAAMGLGHVEPGDRVRIDVRGVLRNHKRVPRLAPPTNEVLAEALASLTEVVGSLHERLGLLEKAAAPKPAEPTVVDRVARAYAGSLAMVLADAWCEDRHGGRITGREVLRGPGGRCRMDVLRDADIAAFCYRLHDETRDVVTLPETIAALKGDRFAFGADGYRVEPAPKPQAEETGDDDLGDALADALGGMGDAVKAGLREGLGDDLYDKLAGLFRRPTKED